MSNMNDIELLKQQTADFKESEDMQALKLLVKKAKALTKEETISVEAAINAMILLELKQGREEG